MEVKTIEVCNASNINARNLFKKRNLSRLLLALLAKYILPKGESKSSEKLKTPSRVKNTKRRLTTWFHFSSKVIRSVYAETL